MGIQRTLHLSDPTAQAVFLWSVFFVTSVIINGTIPFALGVDLRTWSASPVKFMLSAFFIYALLFLVVPLILIKGWNIVPQPSFLLPLALAVAALTLWHSLRGIALVAVIVLAYLHRRFDLSAYGIRWRGWKENVFAILIIGSLGLVTLFFRSRPLEFAPASALMVMLDRLFANPASTVENLFYFGFLTERLSLKTGRWLTPLLVGLMYMAHEMTNPEYWYAGMNFILPFVGVAIFAAIYLWRRSVVVIWLGDGLYRFVGNLF
jgi:hypothetical protein